MVMVIDSNDHDDDNDHDDNDDGDTHLINHLYYQFIFKNSAHKIKFPNDAEHEYMLII